MNTKCIDILLVEDSPEDVDLVKEAFVKSAFTVTLTVADDGDKALRYLRQQDSSGELNNPDLIILDLNLPKKSGLDVLMEIKRDPELKCTPVVIFTTSRSPEDISRAYANHTNCYICKPLNFEDFIDAVRKIEDFWLRVVQLPILYKRKERL